MSQLSTEARLALVVRARVAEIRARRAGARAALVTRDVAPVTRAFARFGELHGRDPDMEAPSDVAVIGGLIAEARGRAITRGMVLSAAEAAADTERFQHAAAEAWRALYDAMPGGDATLGQWVGVDEETIGRAVEQALPES